MLRLDINLLFTALNILIWYFLIRKFLFKPVNSLISRREEAIAEQYAKARQLEEEAQAAKDECALLKASIEEEKAAANTAAKEEARGEYDRIVAEAEEKAKQLMERTKKEAELEKSRIVGKAEQEIRSVIMSAAEASLSSSSSESALYDQFLTKAGEIHAD